VIYRDVYPGVDVVFYGKNGQIEYDFILKPDADPAKIQFAFAGAQKIEVDPAGDLLIHTAAGTLKQHQPQVYQEHDGQREAVAASYRVLLGNHVGFQLASYDRARLLTIDPVLSYSTYLGGSGIDTANAIAVDAAGNAYITGTTNSSKFSTSGAFQSTLSGTSDVFVAKLNPQGTGLVYSTYIGGRRSISQAMGIAVDASGNVYVTGTTDSNTYPVTTGALSAGISGGGAFVTKLNATGNALVYSTYLKGAVPAAIRVDASGNTFVAGQAFASLVTTSGVLQAVNPSGTVGSGFVSKLNATGSALVYSTYLGGTAEDAVRGLAIDSGGNAYAVGVTSSDNFPIVTGAFQPARKGAQDGFVSKLDAAGKTLLFSTYLGGAVNDLANAVAVDASGRIFVAGETFSVDFPSLNGGALNSFHNSTAFNVAFLTVLNPDAASLVISAYFGGKACLTSDVQSCFPTKPNDGATAIAVDASGSNIYLAGYLSSVDVTLVDAIQAKLNGPTDAFVVKMVFDALSNVFRLSYSTRLGGSDTERAAGLAIDAQGNAYVVANSVGTSFPTTQGAFRVANSGAGASDAVIAKLSTLGVPVTLDGSCGFQAGQITQLRATLAINATGNITFMDGSTAIATVPIANGMALFSAPAQVGVHKYTAVRSSDGSVSPPLSCKVEQ